MSEDEYGKTQILSRPPTPIKAPPALLTCVDTSVLRDGVGTRILLGGDAGEDVVTVGRDDENRVSLHAQGVSRKHARVFQENGEWAIEDLGSTNGTRVNNSKLETKQSLSDGDTVAFGRACYKFQLKTAGASTGIDIDLGASEKTMIMQAPQFPATAEDATIPDSASSPIPTAPSIPASHSTDRAPAPAPSNDSGSNAILWTVVVVAFLALVLGGAKLLELL